MVHGADRVGQFGRSQIRSLAQIVAGDGGDGFSALGGIDFSAGGGDRFGLAELTVLRCRYAGGCSLRADLLRLLPAAALCGLGFGDEIAAECGPRRQAAAPKRRQEIPVTMRTDERRKRSSPNLQDCDSRVVIVVTASYGVE